MHRLLFILLLFATPSFAGEFTFSSLGVTYHGDVVDEELAEHMPYKLSDDGKWVFHPMNFSFNFTSTDDFHINATFLRDCFNQQAFLLAAGHHWKFGRLGLGYLLGLYARDKFYFLDQYGNVSAPSDMRFYIETEDTQYIPMALATASFRLKNTEPYVDLLAGGNWFINHAELGVSFSF